MTLLWNNCSFIFCTFLSQYFWVHYFENSSEYWSCSECTARQEFTENIVLKKISKLSNVFVYKHSSVCELNRYIRNLTTTTRVKTKKLQGQKKIQMLFALVQIWQNNDKFKKWNLSFYNFLSRFIIGGQKFLFLNFLFFRYENKLWRTEVLKPDAEWQRLLLKYFHCC